MPFEQLTIFPYSLAHSTSPNSFLSWWILYFIELMSYLLRVKQIYSQPIHLIHELILWIQKVVWYEYLYSFVCQVFSCLGASVPAGWKVRSLPPTGLEPTTARFWAFASASSAQSSSSRATFWTAKTRTPPRSTRTPPARSSSTCPSTTRASSAARCGSESGRPSLRRRIPFYGIFTETRWFFYSQGWQRCDFMYWDKILTIKILLKKNISKILESLT